MNVAEAGLNLALHPVGRAPLARLLEPDDVEELDDEDDVVSDGVPEGLLEELLEVEDGVVEKELGVAAPTDGAPPLEPQAAIPTTATALRDAREKRATELCMRRSFVE